jgi:uncharacterized lipoprotein NlpE involved in copper resistance
MKTFRLLSALVVATSLTLVGCDNKEAGVTETSTVTTPQGETTVTDKTTIETSGENPPPAEPIK